MKIEFARSGGFAGLRLSASLDTETLASENAAKVENLVDAADFFKLPERISTGSPSPDRFEYQLAISARARGRHAIVISENSVPDRLRPLLDYLTSLALHRVNPEGSGNVKP